MGEEDLSWGYGANNGPHCWARRFANAAGMNQSPVNIDTRRVVFDPSLHQHPLKLHQSTCNNPVIMNHGRGFRLEMDTDATLSGGPLTTTYSFAQMHMHWGLSPHYGSEHAVNGLTYAGEMHMVFYDKRRVSSIEEAARRNDTDTVCVLATLIEEGNADVAFEPLIQYLPSISYREQKAQVLEYTRLDVLLPHNRLEYYTYPGSLTTPPCSEIVQWIVFRNHVSLSERQLNYCRQLHGTPENAAEHDVCECNYRTYCPLGSRVVRSSFHFNK